MSATHAARAFGVATETALEWAASTGYNIAHRPKKFFPRLRQQAVLLLSRGAEIKHVAREFSISNSTVMKLLRTEPGLKKRWDCERFKLRQMEARKHWMETAGKLGHPTSAALRSHAPRTFAWLYRNDRQWLADFAGQLSPGKSMRRSTVNWDQRDGLVANA